MEVLPAEGSNSGDGLKDTEKSSVKMNGELNGSVEGMEVDENSRESADGSYESGCENSQVNTAVGSEAEYSDCEQRENDEGKSHVESDADGRSEAEGKSNSHFGSEYDGKSVGQAESMDVDGMDDGEGESINSEDEDQLLNSDNEELTTKEEKSHGEDGDDTDEEGDINDVNEENNKSEGTRTNEDFDNDDDDGDDHDEDKTKDKSENENDLSQSATTPTKKKKKADVSVTPRRSSRTVQKPVRFGQESLVDSDEAEDPNDSDGIEEVTPTDPLADPLIDKENRRYPRTIGSTTIVVSDAKRLADFAVQQRNAAPQPKKEPTLVIIDTNSILAGRGAMPMQTQGGVTITQTPASNKSYSSPQPNYPPKPKPPTILPTLTDDMYVVEAPSFIVPYVYEKPPVKKFKRYLNRMLKQIKKQEEEKERELDRREAEEAAKEALRNSEASEKKDGESTEKEGVEEKLGAKMDVDEETPSSKPECENKEENSEVDVKPKVVSDEQAEKEPENHDEEESKVSMEVEKKPDVEVKEEKKNEKPDEESTESDSDAADEDEDKKKTPGTGSYFANPLGKFFMQIGMNLVQEFVQTDLLKQQKKKQKLGKGTEETQAAIASLKKNLMLSKENNEPYTMEQIKCEFCSFKTESKLIMAHHSETPHMRNYVYRCNFCPLEVRGPHDILLHMENEHCVRGRLERAPAFHQCPQCPFEDNQKGKLTRHLLTCAKKFRPEKNLEPPLDWEPPAKIPRVPRKPSNMPLNVNNPLYQQAMAAKNLPHTLMPKMGSPMGPAPTSMLRPRGRPPYNPIPPGAGQKLMSRGPGMPPQLQRANMMYRPPATNSPVILPASYQISASNQLFQVVGPQGQMMNLPGGPPALQRLGVPPQPQQQKNPATVKLLNQPSISITPLPRQAPANPQPGVPPQRQSTPGTSKTTFVICEICDGYIKDLEQLRNHMQWIHKVKIHPKMIYNRPPLNCQKCQFRFFTDQGLERHLLGSHGLVTSSMQDSANKGKDGGRCPVCGRVYQWKLLNHVARDHNMTLKPAHLSYKCTVCTATFGMYKQFESHVYSAHSVVAKRVMDKKNGQAPPTSRADTATLLKPLKINDEITIIPQPAKKPAQQQQQAQRPVPGNFRANVTPKARGPDSVQVIDLEDSPNKNQDNGAESLSAVKERLRRRKSLEIRQLESEPDGSDSEEGDTSQQQIPSKTNDGEEEEDEEEDGQESEDDEPESDG